MRWLISPKFSLDCLSEYEKHHGIQHKGQVLLARAGRGQKISSTTCEKSGALSDLYGDPGTAGG